MKLILLKISLYRDNVGMQSLTHTLTTNMEKRGECMNSIKTDI